MLPQWRVPPANPELDSHFSDKLQLGMLRPGIDALIKIRVGARTRLLLLPWPLCWGALVVDVRPQVGKTSAGQQREIFYSSVGSAI